MDVGYILSLSTATIGTVRPRVMYEIDDKIAIITITERKSSKAYEEILTFIEILQYSLNSYV